MTNDYPVPVIGDPKSRHLFYPCFPVHTLGCLACFPGEAYLLDFLTMNCVGHKFFVRTVLLGRILKKSLYLQVKICNSSCFPRVNVIHMN